MERALSFVILSVALSGCASQFAVIRDPVYGIKTTLNQVQQELPQQTNSAVEALKSGKLTNPEFGRASAAIVNRWVATIPWDLSGEVSSNVRIEPGMVLSIEGLTPGTHTMVSGIDWEVPDVAHSDLKRVVSDPRRRIERNDFLVARLLIEAAHAQQVADTKPAERLPIVVQYKKDRDCSAKALTALAKRKLSDSRTEENIEVFGRDALSTLLDLNSLSLQLADVRPDEPDNEKYYSTTAAALRERLYSMGPLTYSLSGNDGLSVTELAFNVSTCDHPVADVQVRVTSARDWLYASPDIESNPTINFKLAGEVMLGDEKHRIVVPLGWSVSDIEGTYGVEVLGFRRSDRYFCTENLKPGQSAIREAELCSVARYVASGSILGGKDDRFDLEDFESQPEALKVQRMEAYKAQLEALKSQLVSKHEVNFSFGKKLPGSDAKLQLLLPQSAKSDLIVVHGDLLITADAAR